MKYTIEGFSQEYALNLKKKVIKRDKEIEIKIDCTDLVILRWFVDFYPNMKKLIVDGKEYAWLTHKKLIEDLPLIDISKSAFIERMQKLVEFNILDYKFIKEGGTFSLYSFGKEYENLIRKGERSNMNGVYAQTDTGVYAQTDTKDNTINNISINNNNKESKKESTYDEIIDENIQNEDVKNAIIEFIKMRKSIKKPMTNRALTLMINKLNKLSNGNSDIMVKILDQSILNCWQDIYALKGEQTNKNNVWNNLEEAFRDE